MNAPVPRGRGRGAELLLEHCAALTRLDDVRPSPRERLEALVGDELACKLVRVLATAHGTRPLPLG
jgi:hypothetical protein